MQGEARWIADLFHQAYNGEPGSNSGWHGPALRSLLRGVGWRQAARRPASHAHNILEIVLHIAIWDEVCVRRLSGEKIRMTTGSAGDWPAASRPTPQRWMGAKRRLSRAQKALILATGKLCDDDLDRKVAGWPWTYRLMLHGTLHHDLYHAGQIALIRREIERSR